MASRVSQGSGGVGFCGLLTILFVALKLTGVIAWSWLWVLSPLWIPFIMGMIVVIVVVLCVFGPMILRVNGFAKYKK